MAYVSPSLPPRPYAGKAWARPRTKGLVVERPIPPPSEYDPHTKWWSFPLQFFGVCVFATALVLILLYVDSCYG